MTNLRPQSCSAAALTEVPGTALAAWARRVLNEPLPNDPSAARATLAPLEEWSRRWHELDQHDLPRWGPGSIQEFELLDGVIADLQAVARLTGPQLPPQSRGERTWSAHGSALGVFIVETTDEASTAHQYMTPAWARELARELLIAADKAEAAGDA